MAFMNVNNVTNISNDSVRGMLLFMNGRMCSKDETCWVADDGCIRMQLNNGIETIVKFVSMDLAEFSYATSTNGPTVKKIITRQSEFNGALIEFATKPAEYFEEIVNGYDKCPTFYKQYQVLKSVQ